MRTTNIWHTFDTEEFVGTFTNPIPLSGLGIVTALYSGTFTVTPLLQIRPLRNSSDQPWANPNDGWITEDQGLGDGSMKQSIGPYGGAYEARVGIAADDEGTITSMSVNLGSCHES